MGRSDFRNARIGWPPTGGDLMLGATQAAERWIRRDRAKGFTIGYAQSYAERFASVYAESRRAVIDELRVKSAGSPEILKRLDEMDAESFAVGYAMGWREAIAELRGRAAGKPEILKVIREVDVKYADAWRRQPWYARLRRWVRKAVGRG